MARKAGGFGGRPTAPSWQALQARAPAPAADPFAPTLQRALEHHRRGETVRAEQLYRQVLAANPAHAEASHAVGMLLHQAGKSEAAEPLIRRAVDLAPSSPVFNGNLGIVLVALGRKAEAVEAYRRALKRDPDAPPLHANLASALIELGQAGEAAQAARRALRLKPDYAVAHAQLGRALAALGRPAEALSSLDTALSLNGRLVDAHVWRGDLLREGGDAEAALTSYREAVQLKPAHAGAHLGLAAVFSTLGRHDAAADNYRAVIYLKPSAVAYAGLARELMSLGQSVEAADAYDMALRLEPENAAVEAERTALLKALGRDVETPAGDTLSELEREEVRTRMAVSVTPGNPVALLNHGSALVALGRLREAIDRYREALNAKPDYFEAWSNFLFAINYLGDMPIAGMVAEARHFGSAVSARIQARTAHANPPDPGRPIKVGLVSADLRSHPVGYFLNATVAAMDPGRVELYAYSDTIELDEMTASLKASIPNWREIAGLDDDAVEREILADGIDILLDMAGHTGANRLTLFARKPAPIAVTWLGYFATTGLSTIDYALATRWVIPPEEESQWVETPWRLPETYLCFSPPRLHVPLVSPPALRSGYVTFGSANNINKLNPETAACWANVLGAVPDSRLLLRSRQLADPRVAEKVRAQFGAHGVTGERLTLQGAVGYDLHLARYNEVDIALDPFPYAGGTTTIEALWMGVPVLTLKGDRYVAHMGENILQNMQMPEWIAADAADYVNKAAAFAADPAALAVLRQTLRPRLEASPLMDATRFARHFEAALRGMWQTWAAAQK